MTILPAVWSSSAEAIIRCRALVPAPVDGFGRGPNIAGSTTSDAGMTLRADSRAAFGRRTSTATSPNCRTWSTPSAGDAHQAGEIYGQSPSRDVPST
jgi:hypothetical protein